MSSSRQIANLEDFQAALNSQIEVNVLLNQEVENYAQVVKSKQATIINQQRRIQKLEETINSLNAFVQREKRRVSSGTSIDGYVNKVQDSRNETLEEVQVPLPTIGEQQTPEDPSQRSSTEQQDCELCWPGNEEATQELQVLIKHGREAGWIINHNEITLEKELGRGSQGCTYKGQFRGSVVAVKQITIKEANEAKSFVRELEVISSTRHPRLVPFVGACLQPPQRCWLVFELMPGGNLNTWLHGKPSDAFQPRRTMTERLMRAMEVAQGMCALQEAHPPIIHRDLKPSNIFLDGSGEAKVGDMGLARRLTYDDQLTGETGTYQYMSPEMINHDFYDTKTDVYSWAVLLVQLVRQLRPYEDLYLTPVQIAMEVSQFSLVPTVPDQAPQDLHDLVQMCVDPIPDNRPDFSLIVQLMQDAIIPKVAQIEATPQRGLFNRLVSIGREAPAAPGPAQGQAAAWVPPSQGEGQKVQGTFLKGIFG